MMNIIEADRYILGVSGGKDSAALAVYMSQEFPHLDIEYFFTDTGEVKEFCDPRIQMIKKSIEEVFDVDIHNHSLYFYATKTNSKK